MNTPLFPHVASEFDLRGQVAKEFFANFHTIIENNRVDFVVSTDVQDLTYVEQHIVHWTCIDARQTEQNNPNPFDFTMK